MSKLNGQMEFRWFLDGKALSPKQAIKAQCYICNGEKEGFNEDCMGESCPLYLYFKKWMKIKRGGGEGHFTEAKN